MTLPVIVGAMTKNGREKVRVTLDRFKDHDLVDLRVYAGEGETAQPTKAGVALRVERLPALIDLLRKAEAQARELGLITNGD